jgi:hypothetical protein
MATIKISSLTESTTLLSADVFPVVTGGSTRKITAANMLTYFGGSSGNSNVTNVYMHNGNASLGMTQNQEYTIPFDATASGHDAGDYNTSNYRYTPTVAGWYYLTTHLNFTGNFAANIRLSIYKGTNLHKYIGSSYVGAAGAIAGSALVYFDGVSDYSEIRATQTSSSIQQLENGAVNTWFQAYWVKS